MRTAWADVLRAPQVPRALRRLAGTGKLRVVVLAAAGARYAASAADDASLTVPAGDGLTAPRQRPASLEEAGAEAVPRDLEPGKGTQLIDPEMEVADNFYKPASPVPMERILAYEERRKHFSIYRENDSKEMQVWEGDVPRFIRVPMHMIVEKEDSRNPDLPVGPVLHDTRTGVAIRIMGSMRPSPETSIMEDQLSAKIWTFVTRSLFWGLAVAMVTLVKFIEWMSLRTRLKNQGQTNPILPQTRIKSLEIVWYARENFKQYKEDFAAFQKNHWLPYRVALLQQESAGADAVALAAAKAALAKSEGAEVPNEDELFQVTPEKTTITNPETGISYDIDPSRILVGMSQNGPVYAAPDAEVLDPAQLEARMKKVKSGLVKGMDEDTKRWANQSYNDRAREHANSFVVQFHTYLREKGRITPMDPEKVDEMYELRAIPRAQHVDEYSPDNAPVRAQLVRD